MPVPGCNTALSEHFSSILSLSPCHLHVKSINTDGVQRISAALSSPTLSASTRASCSRSSRVAASNSAARFTSRYLRFSSRRRPIWSRSRASCAQGKGSGWVQGHTLR